MPNSETPIPQAVLDARARRMAYLSQKITDGNNTMGDLINAMTPPSPSGSCSDLMNSSALYNAIGRFPSDVAPLGQNFNGFTKKTAPASSKVFTRPLNRAGFVNYPYGAVQNEAMRLIPDCPCYNPKSCECGVPPKPVKPVAVAPVVAAIAAATPKPKNCRTDNICRDIRSGCVNQDQVSKAQLFACSQAGWAGTWGVFGPVINGPYLGELDLNPAAPGPDDTFGKRFEIAQRFGLSGVVTDLSQSSVFWACLGVGAVALWYVSEHVKRHR